MVWRTVRSGVVAEVPGPQDSQRESMGSGATN